MIRKTTINLSNANTGKLAHLDHVLQEYNRCVNLFIDYLWEQEQFAGSFVKDTNWLDSWLSARLLQAAAKEALAVVKSQRKKQNKVKPSFAKLTMNLDSRFVAIGPGNNSFDIWITLTSLGNKLKLVLPSKKHHHFNKFNDWSIKKSIRIRKTELGFFADVFFEKPAPLVKKEGSTLGVDVGYKKLLVDSNGNQYGTGFESLCTKISKKQQGSKAFKRALSERDCYINSTIKQLPLDECRTLVVENLKNVKHGTKQTHSMSTRFMNKLQRWTYSKVISRIRLTSELLGVQVIEVNPRNTSRTCFMCKHVDKKSRKGERFKCTACGYTADADHNGAMNILTLGSQEHMVPVPSIN